jgi:hypothetical protein
MKHLEHILATYVYSYCNIYNIPIYFCNIHIKHLQHTSETFETYACNMHFQQNLVDGQAEHCTTGCNARSWWRRGMTTVVAARSP